MTVQTKYLEHNEPEGEYVCLCVEIELPNPNFAGAKISGAMNENLPPSTTAWTGTEWSGSRIIAINPKSLVRQARGESSVSTRMFVL